MRAPPFSSHLSQNPTNLNLDSKHKYKTICFKNKLKDFFYLGPSRLRWSYDLTALCAARPCGLTTHRRDCYYRLSGEIGYYNVFSSIYTVVFQAK